ncbi:multidrug ABC transporter ATP-binding protein [Amycolatopsis antarctica]|uniref:Multidrug ABC transporter ATP-binding protein n=1 Tax=Amycolatopsis antarctica TaxID=1854586 RepID=A0A263D7L0_9PSEU|nr:ABC transporter ATP-binding protein [Amycolatopsis antarctica]OZM74159.1 multidrug ABC transporter ATP-binding protein [Amycolatopsis antarctica]
MLTGLLRGHLPPHRRAVAAAAALQLVEVVTLLLLPTLNASIIDRGVIGGDHRYIVLVGGLMVLVAGLAMVAGVASIRFAARAAMGLGRDLRAALFSRVLTLSGRQVDTFGPASLSTRSVNDVQQVEGVVLAGLTTLASAVFICLASVVLGLRQDLQLGAALAALIPVIAVVIWFVRSRLSVMYGRLQSDVDRLNRIVGERLSGVRVVRAFSRDNHERDRFTATNTDLFAYSLRAGRLMATMFPTIALISNLATAGVVWLGASRLEDGAVGIGTVNAFVEYLVFITWSITMTTFVFLAVPRAEVSAGRIGEVLRTESELPEPASPACSAGPAGTVELRGVEFRYPGAELPALTGVDLSMRPGERVAVVGGTGSGKTTLVNLICRRVDPTAGSVLVNGVDVRELDVGELTDTLGVVPQHTRLFDGTVADNLRFGEPAATDGQLWDALEAAHARAVVEGLPGGLDAEITHGGGNLSGGQRQRLTIARTLLRRPRVYLFDDCFSALDPVIEAGVRTGLRARTGDAAVLVVAQRVSTIQDADRIVVLDAGRVVGCGAHAELLAGCETYRDIVGSQLIGPVAR